LKILAITDKDSGCGYHRVTMPVAAMALPKEDHLITNCYEEEFIAKGWDIIFYNRFIPELPIEQLLEYKKKYGFKIVVDIDDYWKIDPHHIMHDDYKDGLMAVTINNIVEADMVTTTHERLAEVISILNKNVHVLPNAIAYGEGFCDDSKWEDEKVRLIYAASIFHQGDVALLRGPMKKVHSDSQLRNKIKMVMCGLHDKECYSEFVWKDMQAWERDNINKSAAIWHAMINDYTCALKIRPVIERSKSVYDYMQFYKLGDIGLIPLRDTGFNAMKSNLKILECAAKKIPVIVSDVHPYKDFPHTLKVNNQGDWYKHIKYLVDNPEARKDQGEKLYEYCKQNFDLRAIAKQRKQLFETLIS
jgi:glycosyltransferase involved in cell wall biosynthesis